MTIPLEQQGLLLFNLQQLTKRRPKADLDLASKETVESQKQKIYSSELDQGFPSVCLLDSNNPDTFLNLLKGYPKKNDLLLRLSTFELSSLVPLIRIFKIFRNPLTNKEICLEIPFDTKATGIDNIFESGTGRGTGAGITSFNWKQNPKNEAHGAVYRAQLSLYLQNVDEFFRPRNSIQMEGELLQVSINDLLYQRKEWRKKTNTGTNVYDVDAGEIKAIVGWQISEQGKNSIIENHTGGQAKELIEAIENQKDVLYLNFISHAIKFAQDGSLELDIDFFGRTEVIFSDPSKSNVLTVGKFYELEIQKIKDSIINIQKKKEERNPQIPENIQLDQTNIQNLNSNPLDWLTNLFSSDQNKEEEELKDEESKLREKLENLQKTAKKAKYNYIIAKLLQKQQIEIFSYKPELLEVLKNITAKKDLDLSVPQSNKNIEEIVRLLKEFEKTQKGPILDQLSYVRNFNDVNISVTARETFIEQGVLKIYGPGTNINEETERCSGLSNFSRGTEDQRRSLTIPLFSDETFEKKTDELYEIYEEGFIESVRTENRNLFPFFYLGDFVNAVLDPLHNTNESNPNFITKQVRVILGPMTIIDYGSIVDNGQIYKVYNKIEGEQYVRTYSGKKTVINIGDIPISLSEFTKWFNENVVNKSKETWTLNELLTSMINDLVFSTLKNEVYKFAPKQKAKVAIDMFKAITSEKNENVFINSIDKCGLRISAESLETLKTAPKDAEKDTNQDEQAYRQAKDYIIIYCVNNTPDSRIVEYEKDKKDGILHLYAGDSKGLIRDITFSRIDNPHRRADNILAATADGRQNSGVIREKYNANIELFGNTNFQAGTYIFLSPTFQGAQSTIQAEKQLRKLGLGGYYMLTEVNNEATIGDFKTSIKAVWIGFGDGDYNDGTTEYEKVNDPNKQPTLGVLR